MVGGDPAGFPNGRRVFDDVVTVELRAIAGVTVPLVDKSFTPDAAASLVTDGLTAVERAVRLPQHASPTSASRTAASTLRVPEIPR